MRRNQALSMVRGYFQKGKELDHKKFMESYRGLSDQEKLEVLKELSSYNVVLDGIDTKDPYELRKKLVGERERFFKSFIRARGGLKFLLDLRADIRRFGRRAEFDFSGMDKELVFLFDAWFDEGFLYIKPVTLDTPYRQIAFLKDHDMVHPMTSIEDMAKRLGKDRLCFAMYHVLMPHEPVIFIEVALTRGIKGKIKDIIEGRDEGKPDTAMFYSINNTQQGLAGLGLGKLLIARVMEEIKREYPHIKNFSTLSPIPSLWPRYLKPLLKDRVKDFKLKPEDIEGFFGEDEKEFLTEGGKKGLLDALYQILQRPDWFNDEELCKVLEEPLKKIVHFYITQEKDERGRPLDPVASFHLGNGAKTDLEYIRFLGNTYPYGVKDSLTFMVNYVYEISWMEQVKRSIPGMFKTILRRS